MKLFLKDICLRPSCHECQFKSMDRSSDITLGDCWEIGKVLPAFNDDKGTSVIIIHSLKGEKIFENICTNMKYSIADLDVIVSKNEDSRKSVKMHINRKKFFEDFEKGASINQLIGHLKESIFDKMRKKFLNKLHKG